MRRSIVLLGASAALLHLAAKAEPDDSLPPPRYTVKTEEPRTGTRIPSTVVSGFRVPLNRTWSQLTPEEQRLVKSEYEVMSDADEPPYPLLGLYPLYRDAQKLIQHTQETGVLALVANVDATGTVTSVEALRPGAPDLLGRAAQLLTLTRFKPALCKGQPCAMGFPLRLNVHREL